MHHVGLIEADVPVDQHQPSSLNVGWGVVNAGGLSPSDRKNVITGLSQAVEGVVDEFFGSGSIFGKLAGKLATLGLDTFFADCNGVVAAGKITLSGSDLYKLTANGIYRIKTFFPGTDSPHGCGSRNSQYWTFLEITRTSGTN